MIYISVHNRLNVARFAAGAVIFNHGIRAENVRTNLAAPFYLFDFALYCAGFRHTFFFALFEQLVFKHTHCLFFVLNLRALVLTGDDYTRRQVGYSYRRFGLVDVLTARAARTIRVHLDFFGADFYIAVLLNIRHYVYRRERRLSSRIGVERRNSDESVYTLFGL